MARSKESFVFYKDWWDAIRGLPEDVRGEVCESIIGYAFGETVTGLGSMATMAMRFITPQIDRDREKYEMKCEKNRENGALGGRSRQNGGQANATERYQSQANATECKRTGGDNENENENDNVNDNENECECETRTPAQALSPEEDLFNKFQAWLRVYAPTVVYFTEPLQCDEFIWLHRKYGAEKLKQCAAEMHNKEAYLKNRKALTVFKSWIKNVKL